jgi:phospholipase C
MTSAWLESFGDVSRYNFSTTRKISMDGYVHIAENFAKSGSGSGTYTDTNGDRAMAYYNDVDLNYYYYMASQFALSDRWFAPMASKTIPNRIATLSGGTTQGYTHDPSNDDNAGQLSAMTIFQLLDQHGISWKIYYEQTNSDGTPTTEFSHFTYANNFIHHDSTGKLVIDSQHIAPISQYYTDVQNGTLPAFSYIQKADGTDEHPGSGTSIFAGQQDVAKIINALMYSPSWKDSVFFMSFDEPGGPYDHVPPVPGHTNDFTDASLKSVEGDVSAIAVNPDQYLPCVPTTAGVYNNHCDLRPSDPGAKSTDAAAIYGFAAQIGARVPNMIISPFSKPHYVGHKAMDHTAVLRFLEQRYNLPAMTKRDAAQPDLLDFFDFTNPPWMTPPPQSSVPAPPSVGSTCHPSTMH